MLRESAASGGRKSLAPSGAGMVGPPRAQQPPSKAAMVGSEATQTTM
jgi:hypothetical protein